MSPNSSNSGPPTARSTSNYIASVQQKAMENYEAELKRVNNEWGKKLDAIKKTYEEKLQNQEADFAWKYSTKEDEIEKLRVEKRKLEENVKNVEGIYQSKISRAHDDIDQLEGYTKQEMAKVKHLVSGYLLAFCILLSITKTSCFN
jgi:predicted nuclease with TOPRIM domain